MEGKILKKKFLSFILCICIAVSSMFSLIGCSVVKENTQKINSSAVLKVGDKVITQNDIVTSFSSFYSNNVQLLSQASEATIMNSFYNWIIAREIEKPKAEAALEEGKIVYSQEDEDDVWEDVFESFYYQVGVFEKKYYEKEDDYPDWLREETEKTEKISFSEYKSVVPSLSDLEEKTSVEKIDLEEIKNTKIQSLKDYLFQFKSGEDEREEIVEPYIENRRKAYADFISYLSINAKAAEKNQDFETLLLDAIENVYDSCYTTKINDLYEEYLLKNYLVDTTNGDTVSLSDKEIAKAYLTLLNVDKQRYLNESSYVSVLSSSISSLVLYHYNGEDCFFSVQHILATDDDLRELISNLDYCLAKYTDENGNEQVFNSDYENYATFLAEREELIENYNLVSKASEDSLEELKSIAAIIDNETYIEFYYYDDSLTGNTSKYVKVDVSQNGDEKTYTRTDNGELVDEKHVSKMSTKEQIIAAYNCVLGAWSDLVDAYVEAADEEAKQAVKSETNNVFEDMFYIFDLVDKMSEGKTVTTQLKDEIKSKVASLLFVEMEWIFSADGLDNKLNNKIGYFIPNMENESGRLATEFASKAREILQKINAEERTNSFVDDFNVTVTDYGYHIIKVENIYRAGETIVDMLGIADEIDLDDADYVESVISALKATFTSTASTETLYDYFRDLIYSTLTDEDNNVYLSNNQINWIKEYNDQGKIKFINKLSYNQIVDLIG